MMKLTAFVVGTSILLTISGAAVAHPNNGLEGLVIGGAGGAVIGHVVSGTPEGVIVGSFLGGTLGMLIDARNNHDHVVVIKERHRHHRHWPAYYDRGSWSHRSDRHYFGKHRKHGHRDRWDHRRDNGWGWQRDRHHR